MGVFERKIIFSRCLVLLSLVIFCAPTAMYAQQQYELLTPESIVALTNIERRAVSLPAYRENEMLAAAAEDKARDMATRSYFSHATPEGEKTWNLVREHGYTFSRVGENLAVKFTDPARAVSLWLASPGHRANLLNEKFIDIGVGVAEGLYQGATTTFIVALYATPLTTANEAVGEVKGEQEPSQESAGLLASVEPERDQVIAKEESKTETLDTEGSLPQQAAVSTVSPFDTLRSASGILFQFLWGLFRW